MDPRDLRNQLDPRSGFSPEHVDPAQAQRPRPTVEDTLVDERVLAGHTDAAPSWNAESADLADSADQVFAFSNSFKSFYSSLVVLYKGGTASLVPRDASNGGAVHSRKGVRGTCETGQIRVVQNVRL